jgi:hypothetical protein
MYLTPAQDSKSTVDDRLSPIWNIGIRNKMVISFLGSWNKMHSYIYA